MNKCIKFGYKKFVPKNHQFKKRKLYTSYKYRGVAKTHKKPGLMDLKTKSLLMKDKLASAR